MELAVNVCCREEKAEFSGKRFNVYRDERNQYFLDGKRKGSKSKWKAQQQADAQKQYEICCWCETEGGGDSMLTASSDQHGNKTSRRRGKGESTQSSTDQDMSSSRPGDVQKTVDPYSKPAPPVGWTESEILLLKRAVEKVARTQRVKKPGFAAMQAIQEPLSLNIPPFTQ
jgi:hypothetical protein